MRIIGMDIHRVAAGAVVLLDGKSVKHGRIPVLCETLERVATNELKHDDHVIVEAAGNAAAVVEVLASYVGHRRGRAVWMISMPVVTRLLLDSRRRP